MDNEHEWARMLDALAADVSTHSVAERHALLRRGLDLACTVGDDTAGCSITEANDGGFHTPAHSSELALELDLVQYAAGTGPCVAACRDGEVHSISVMGAGREYAAFTAAAQRAGVGSSLSLPLPGAHRPAALNLYAKHPSAFEATRTRAIATLLARCVAKLLPDAVATDPLPSGADFDEAMGRRRLMQRAVTATSETGGLDRGSAFEVLIQRSRTEDRSIFAVARDIVEGSDR